MSLKEKDFGFSLQVLLVPLATVLLMWLVFWAEFRFRENLTEFGVYPRSFTGLRGVLFSPFIHSSLEHLFNNSIPFLVLLAGLFYFYRPVAWKVFLMIYLFSGLGTWLIGRESYHIGASGIIYGLAAFLFFKGIWSKHYRLTAFSLIVIFLYGGLIWGTIPLDPGMSWEGHLSGLVSGLLLAFFVKRNIPKPAKFEWEQEGFREDDDPFLRHFDKDGNFIEELPEVEENDGCDGENDALLGKKE